MKHMRDNGFTLIELMVAMAVASIVMGVVVMTYQLQVRSRNTQEVLTDMNQSARAALEIMTREIRTAGCDPEEIANAALVTANNNQISFTRDIINTAGDSYLPDGLLDGPNEQITYGLYNDGDGNQNLGRTVGAAGVPQPLLRNVDALDFIYNGTTSVEITIVARAGENRAGVISDGFTGRHRDTRAYTNQQGTVILPAQNDGFRRLLLTTTVNLVNLWP